MKREFKQPNEIVLWTIPYVDRTGSGITLLSATGSATVLATGVSASSDVFSSTTGSINTTGEEVTFTLKAGQTSGTIYKITCRATLSNSNILEEDAILEVREI